MAKIEVTFEEDNTRAPKINGVRTTPHSDGNNGRHVYICNEYVLKVDDRGYSHDDMAAWRRIQREDRKYFVPILAQGVTKDGDFWSIQPYVALSFNVTDDDAEIVAELCSKYDINDIDVYDTSARNWAINVETGEPIIFDYGLGQ